MVSKTDYEELKQHVKAHEKELLDLKVKMKDLTAEKANMRALLDGLASAEIGVDMIGTDYRVLYQNQILKERFGDIKNQLCYENYMGAKAPCAYCPMTKAIATDKIERVEIKGNDDRHYELVSIPLHNAEGKIDRTIEIIKDITINKDTCQALRESEKNYENLFNSYGDGILIAELKTMQFIEANPAMCKLLGYTREELLTKSVNDIHPAEALEAVKQEFIAQAKGEKLIAHNIPCLTKQGGIVYTDISTTHATVMGRECNIGLFRDITEKIKIEQHLNRTQKMEAISTLAGGIAHDFNNILSIVIGNASYALARFDNNPDLVKVLSEIQSGMRQAQALTQQLLTFAKGGEPIRKVVNLNEPVKDSANFASSGIKSKCRFQLQDDLWTTEVDLGQIHQVISNLVINAAQAMPEGGIIDIRTENCRIESKPYSVLSPGRYVKILVKDQGIGISEKHISQIFDPFFSTKQTGSGLGLSTVYSIVKNHGGHIMAASELGLGTIFEIYIPASDKALQTAAAEQAAIHKGKGSVLIMDDQESILKLVESMLNLMGYKTALAKDGTQALEMYQKAFLSDHPFDLVILDLTVPGGMGGAEIMPQLLQINPNVKAIVSSGYANDPIMANYKDYGFSGVVPKPYTIEQIAEVLNNLCG